MNKKIKIAKAKQLAWLFLPCLALVGAACFPNVLSSKWWSDSLLSRRVLVDEVTLTPVPTVDKGFNLYLYSVYIRYRGLRPKWWNRATFGYELTQTSLVNPEGQKIRWLPGHYTIYGPTPKPNRAFYGCYPGFDERSGRFFIRGDVSVPVGYKMKEAVFATTIKTPNTSNIKCRIPIHIKPDSDEAP